VPATVVFLDDNEDLRELMPILLKTALGLDCLCFGNLREIQNREQEVLEAKLAILDINLGSSVPDGIDAFHWLKAHGFHGKVLFLTGHARNNPRMNSAEINGAKLLEKPLRPDQLIAYVAHAIYGSS
jgi:DNA-binding NtrC family response regulator